MGFDERTQIVGLFHDLLEDTDINESMIAEFGDDILHAVKLVTRPAGMNEDEYISRIVSDKMAAAVKSVDKIHNVLNAVYAGGPNNRRDKEKLEYASHYVNKAAEYYYGQFNLALDKTIGTALAELSLYPSYIPEHKLPFGKSDMVLYTAAERINYNDLKHNYSADAFPEINRRDCTLYKTYDGNDNYYAVYGDALMPVKEWILGRAGWVPCGHFIFNEDENDLREIPKREFSSVIAELRNNAELFPFVKDADLLGT